MQFAPQWVAAIAVVTCGCGRIGFPAEARPDGLDAPVGCAAERVSGFDLGTGSPIAKLGIAATPSGFSLGFLRDHDALVGVELDAQLVPRLSQPQRTTPILGVVGDYVDVSMQWDGSQLVAGMTTGAGELYLKVFPTDMGQFSSAVTPGSGTPSDPLLAPNASGSFAWTLSGSEVRGFALGPDGVWTGGTMPLAAGAFGASSAATAGQTSVVIASRQGGDCVYAAWTGTASETGNWADCSAPFVIGDGAALRVVYKGAAGIAVRTLDTNAGVPMISVSPERSLAAPATFARAVVVRGEVRYVTANNGFAIIAERDTGPTAVPLVGLPTGPADAWAVAARDDRAFVFATYARELWTAEVCD